MDYQKILKKIYKRIKAERSSGKVASYIPELAKVDRDKLGIHLACINGENYSVGDSDELFSIQSISKVLALSMAFKELGGEIWQRIGVEPSGDAFNSLALLEQENGIPRNPLINSGALVISDVLLTILDDPFNDLLEYIRKLANNPDINYNPVVAASEKKWGHWNAALINLMKSFDNIKNPVEDVLDFYVKLCSLEMTCKDLANTFLLFANHGVLPNTEEEERLLTKSRTKRINAIMQTCGFYDQAGEFSFKVGLPGKSGVGGGIVAIHPHRYVIAVWSPPLNEKGNSAKGLKALEWFTTETEMSVF